MTERDRQQRERFVRIISFAASHEDSFPTGKPAAAHIDELKEAVRKFDELAAQQDQSEGSGQAATTSKRDLIDAVREDLAGLSRVARALESERPGLHDRFRLPTSKADEALLAAARAALSDLNADAALTALFLDYGMPEDFVADLTSDIAAAQSAEQAQDQHGGARRESTLAIAAAMEEGTSAVEKLDAYAQNLYRSDAVLLGAWKSASHLETRRSRPAEKVAKAQPAAQP